LTVSSRCLDDKKIGLRCGRWNNSIALAAGTLSLLDSLSDCANLPLGADSETGSQRCAGIRLQLAVGYGVQGQLEVGPDEIKQALLVNPLLADAYSVRDLIYMNVGENRLSDDNFQRALRLSPNNPDFINNYDWLSCQNGRAKESIIRFGTALKSRAYQSSAKTLTNASVCSLKFNDTVAAEHYLFLLRADVQNSEALWTSMKVERKLGDVAAEASLVTQLHRRFAGSPEFSAYFRGAFNEFNE